MEGPSPPGHPRTALLPPPMDAHDLRTSILTRLEHYNKFLANPQPRDGTDSSQAVGFRILQAALLKDTQALLHLTTALETKLDSQRWRKWLINAGLAGLSHFVCYQLLKLPFCRSFVASIPPTLVTLLPLVGYPIALFKISLFENRLRNVTHLQEDLDAMVIEVQRGEPVQQTAYFESDRWSWLPWGH